MAHRRATNYAKNYCNRTLIVKVIVENVVTCFFRTRCSCQPWSWLWLAEIWWRHFNSGMLLQGICIKFFHWGDTVRVSARFCYIIEN